MKKQMMMLFSALLVLFTVLPASQIEAAEVTTPAKQEFELPLDVLQVENDDKSATAQYVKTPAKIVIEDGKTFAYVTLLSSNWWQSLKVQTTQPGTFAQTNFANAELISEDKAANTRLVKFEVQDLKKELNAKIHIIVTGVPGLGEYDHSYDIRLKFDSSKVPATPEVKPVTPVKPEVPATKALKDGAYTIDYKALHEEEDKASSMTRYIETPATLSVKDGKNLVTLTLNNNEQITAFQVEQAGKFVDTTVVKTDVAANIRVVEFEVADLSTIINSKFTVFVAAANHVGNYTVRLAFDKESAKPVVTEEETPVTFTDINKTWAKPYIESLASKQIIKGKTPTTFAPNDKITRGQFAILLSRSLELPKQDFQGTFSDVTKKMDWISFEAAGRAGIIKVTDGKFRPNQPITRQQMATMIIRAIEYKDASVLEGVKNDVIFADAKDITAYAKTSVDLAAGLGIVNGKEVKGKDVFEPKANATRAHASKMVYYMLETLQK